MKEKIIPMTLQYNIVDKSPILNDGKARYVFNITNATTILHPHLSVACLPDEVETEIQKVVTKFQSIYDSISEE